jgi:hypothetical protein
MPVAVPCSLAAAGTAPSGLVVLDAKNEGGPQRLMGKTSRPS